jgi:hypothetical protein
MPQATKTPLTTRSMPTTLQLTYWLQAPGDVELTIKRDIEARPENDGIVFLEKLSLTPSSPLTADLELEIPYSFQSVTDGARARGKGRVGDCLAVSPLKNGWAKPQSLAATEVRCEYRLGATLSAQDTPELALPLMHFAGGDWQGALLADPEFSCLFSARQKDGAVEGSLRFRYAGSQVPLKTTEFRTFAIWLPNLHSSGASSQGRALASSRAVGTVLRDGSLTVPSREFERSVDDLFRLLLPDVAPGPPWLHQIAMVGYDFLSDDGQGWERDVRLLADWLKPAQRRRVALCLHGWYDALGSYSYDAMRTQGLVLRAVPKLAQQPLELQLGRRDRLPLHPLGRPELRCSGCHQQRLGRRPRPLRMAAVAKAGPIAPVPGAPAANDPCAIPAR